jgi:quercetin dioxygenase-like cupin family protein
MANNPTSQAGVGIASVTDVIVEPVIVSPSAGPTHWQAGGDRHTLRISGEQTDGNFALMEIFVVPGGGPPLHVHSRESETFHVIDGEATFTLGEHTVRTVPGTTVHVPPNLPHAFRSEGTTALRMVMVIAPAGLERLFAEVGVSGRADDPVPPRMPPLDAPAVARLVEMAGRYGTTFPAMRDP